MRIVEEREKFIDDASLHWLKVYGVLSSNGRKKLESVENFSAGISRLRRSLSNALEVDPFVRRFKGDFDANVIRVSGERDDGVMYRVEAIAGKHPEMGMTHVSSKSKYPNGTTVSAAFRSDVVGEGLYVVSHVIISAGGYSNAYTFSSLTDNDRERLQHSKVINYCVRNLLAAVKTPN